MITGSRIVNHWICHLSSQCMVSTNSKWLKTQLVGDGTKQLVNWLPTDVNFLGKKTQVVSLDVAKPTFVSELSKAFTVIVTDPDEILFAISAIYSLSSNQVPSVFLVDSSGHDFHHSRNALSTTGAVVLISSDVSDIYDNTLVSLYISLKHKVPVIHFYDGTRSATDFKLNAIPEELLSSFKYLWEKYVSDAESAEKDLLPLSNFFRKTQYNPVISSDVLDSSIKDTSLSKYLSKPFENFKYNGNPSSTSVVVVYSDSFHNDDKVWTDVINDGYGVVVTNTLKPWSSKSFLNILPKSVESIAVADNSLFVHKTMKKSKSGSHGLSQLFVEVSSSILSVIDDDDSRASVTLVLGSYIPLPVNKKNDSNRVKVDSQRRFEDGFIIGDESDDNALLKSYDNVFNGEMFDFPTTPGEQSYIKILSQIFTDRLSIVNLSGPQYDDVQKDQNISVKSTVDFAYGSTLQRIQSRRKLADKVFKVLSSNLNIDADLKKELQNWIDNKNDSNKFDVSRIHHTLENSELRRSGRDESLLLNEIYKEDMDLFRQSSYWIVVNDRWIQDIGNAGVHNIISSGEKINILLIDTEVYSEPDKVSKRKKDFALYAINYGSVYVASTAIYASYSQTFQSLVEADEYPGVSLVVGYAPFIVLDESDPRALNHFDSNEAILMMKETKQAVDSGSWPLYRFNPHPNTTQISSVSRSSFIPTESTKTTTSSSTTTSPSFILDSEVLKKEVHELLKREQYLASLVVSKSNSNRGGHYDLVNYHSFEDEFVERHSLNMKNIFSSFNNLKNSLNGPPILFLYGSDGGNAESVARRLADGARDRGAVSTLYAMNDFSVHDLPEQKTVVFVISTAGQGEFPVNAKEFWRDLSEVTYSLPDTQFTVFAMGDSHYWPRPEESIYFCKSGKDLDAKLGALGGYRFLPLGVGDDQDVDGYEHGLKIWEEQLWNALDIGSKEVEGKEKVPSDDEIKKSSNYLRGTILKGLDDTSTGSLCFEDTKLTKFHGIYQQDDRDLREDRRKRGLEKAFSFMARVRVPGGIITPKQWLSMDEISDKYANSTVKITTRQAIQFHGILKRNLKQSIKDVNRELLDTLAACGDVCRNVMCNPNPAVSSVHEECYLFAKKLSDHLTPRTSAYHEIWLDKVKVGGESVDEIEPLYGSTYLPRKFKVSVAIPPNNDVDVYAQCLGYIAIVNQNSGKLEGFNVTIGGGMGMTHNNKKTYPALSQLLCFCTVEQAVDVGEKVMLVQRDYGDRKNRKHARLKYTVEDNGIEWYRQQVEERLGYKLEDPRSFPKFTTTGDDYNWLKGKDGKWHKTIFIENGRVRDTPEYQLKTALRELAQMIHGDDGGDGSGGGDFRLTGNQNLIVSGVTDTKKEEIERLFKKYNIKCSQYSGLRLNSVACVALPTCALALAESERYLPRLVTLLDNVIEESGLRNDSIVIRMSGCPNGCSRPYVAEIALVGRSPGIYNLYLGAGYAGDRLNKLYKESLDEKGILSELTPIIQRYSKERQSGEHFGDFVIRTGYVKATTSGKDFHN
eukprot:TRINITY_DN824_c3_g1_i1.p1 TRINITY_DN824_c3_g1~~TRINITY_DN824_c3_g1_i1.p1  ORF type:complete len:1529 (-),score=411.01 TRINITY_DN824_c3_g1_i1:160-4746(-)